MDKRFWAVKITSLILATIIVYGAIKINFWLDSIFFE